MAYRCPACPTKVTQTSRALCLHMLETESYLDDKHRKWITARGLDFIELLRLRDGRPSKASYEPLVAAIEKECKIEEQKG